MAERGEGGKWVTTYDPKLALKIVERIADGELLRDICQGPGMPSARTFRAWVVNNPKLMRAYHGARELSAEDMEERALTYAEEIRKNPGSAVKVSAYNTAINQLRWSAQRRNPDKYGEKANVNVRVPIQIHTTLAMAEGQAPAEARANIYEVTATVPKEIEAAPVDDAPLHRIGSGPRKRVLTPRVQVSHTPFSKIVRGENEAKEKPQSEVKALPVPEHREDHGSRGSEAGEEAEG